MRIFQFSYPNFLQNNYLQIPQSSSTKANFLNKTTYDSVLFSADNTPPGRVDPLKEETRLRPKKGESRPKTKRRDRRERKQNTRTIGQDEMDKRK